MTLTAKCRELIHKFTVMFEGPNHFFLYGFYASLLAIFTSYCIIKIVKWNLFVDVQYNPYKEGSAIFISSTKKKSALIPVSASQKWVNSGFTLKKHTSYLIKAKGYVNLAVHRLVEDAVNDTRPEYGWVQPSGVNFTSKKFKDIERVKHLVYPGLDKIGMLLAYIPPPNSKDTVLGEYPTHDLIIPVGSEKIVTNTTDADTEIWFIVNDTYFPLADTLAARKAYFDSDSILAERYKEEPLKIDSVKKAERKKFDYIVQNKYSSVWYDDNVGQYFVSIEEQ